MRQNALALTNSAALPRRLTPAFFSLRCRGAGGQGSVDKARGLTD